MKFELIEVDDYHEFKYLEDTLGKRVREIGFSVEQYPNCYIGMIYGSKRPTLDQLNSKCLKKYGHTSRCLKAGVYKGNECKCEAP